MPCRRAFPERVAFGSLSTELGEVKMYLNACEHDCDGDIGISTRNVRQQGGHFGIDHSRDLEDHSCSRGIGIRATGLQR